MREHHIAMHTNRCIGCGLCKRLSRKQSYDGESKDSADNKYRR